MKPLSIRARFALWSTALVGLVLVAFASATFLNLYHEQMEQVDLELSAAGHHVGGLSEEVLLEEPLEELVQFQPWMHLAVFDPDGHIVRRNPELPEEIVRVAHTIGALETVHAHDDRSFRIMPVRNGRRTVLLAYSLEEVEDIVGDLVMSFALSLPVVLLFAGVGGWWVSGKAVQGLKQLTESAERITANQLHRRIPVPKVNDEIRRLADVLNAMLSRLEASFEQSQRFAADASHELRTPLTILGGEVTRLLHSGELTSKAEKLALSMQEEISRLQHITEQILLLAKFDAAGSCLVTENVDLSAVLREACEDAELLGAARGVIISSEIEAGVYADGEAIHLRRLFLNLLDNATRYNRPGGTVRCTLRRQEDKAVLSVGNSGAGIPVVAQSRLFTRFFRSDEARSRGGHGLGLSLCREIVKAHLGQIRLESSTPEWTEFVVALPLSARKQEQRRAELGAGA